MFFNKLSVLAFSSSSLAASGLWVSSRLINLFICEDSGIRTLLQAHLPASASFQVKGYEGCGNQFSLMQRADQKKRSHGHGNTESCSLYPICKIRFKTGI